MKTDNWKVPGNPKRERKLTKDWWDRAVLKSITQDDVAEELARVRKSDPKFWLRLILDSTPKEIRSDSNGLHVSFVLNGVELKPITGRVLESRSLPTNQCETDTLID